MNELIINSRTEFDYAVWQTKNEETFDYNAWKKRASEALQRVYNCIDADDPVDTADLNVLGDVINMLDHINIDAEPQAGTWTVTIDDFYKYDTHKLTEDQKRAMVNKAARALQNNDYVADCYWECISYAAEEFGCVDKEELRLNLNARYIRCYREECLEEFHTNELDIDEYDELSDHDKIIANIMTEHEDGMEWEDQPIDYETAMELLIEMIDANPEHTDVRWCSECGRPFYEGYLLGDDYACSDECRNALYREWKHTDSDEEAYKAYLIDCHELNEEDVQGMTANEIADKYADSHISDYYMFTSWF